MCNTLKEETILVLDKKHLEIIWGNTVVTDIMFGRKTDLAWHSVAKP